jgi:transcription factor IIIB subunit 2
MAPPLPKAHARRVRLPSLRGGTPSPSPRASPAPQFLPVPDPAPRKRNIKTCTGCSEADIQEHNGQLVCMNCGTVASDSVIVNDVTFGEAASGAALVQGTTIHAGERTTRQVGIGFRRGGITKEEAQANALRAGQDELKRLANALHISNVLETATHMYTLARMHAFQRPIKENAAVALYVACRKTKGNTTMLIDLAEQIKMNVFDLGATYKKFVQAVNYDGELENIPLIEIEPVIMKFAQRLEFGDATRQVAADAASILARMDRDWMVTGRQPMGLVGACLLLAARMNNFRRTLREVVFVVRAGEVTILKRLEEFRATDAGRMPVQDFRAHAQNLKRSADPPSFNRELKKRKTLQLGDDEPDDEDGASPTPPIHALRRDADGFLIPAPPRPSSTIDPKLLGASQARERTETDSVEPSDAGSEVSTEDGTALRRKKGRPKKERPEPLIVTPDDLRAENELETEIASIVERRIAEEDSESFNVSFARAKALAEIEKAKQRKSSTWSHSTLPMGEIIGDDEFEDDPEVANCLLDAKEVEVKETIWVTHNHDWLRAQQDKMLREQMEEAKGNRKKMGPRRKMGRRGDGSVLGSTPVTSPAEASQRMLEKRAGHRMTFSKNLNYDRLKAIYGGDDESSSSASSPAPSVYSRASSRSVSASPAPVARTINANKGRVGRARAKQDAEKAQAVLPTPAATQATKSSTAKTGSQNEPMQIEDDELSDAETVEEDGDIAQVRARLPQYGDDDEEVEDIDDDDDPDDQLRRAGFDF